MNFCQVFSMLVSIYLIYTHRSIMLTDFISMIIFALNFLALFGILFFLSEQLPINCYYAYSVYIGILFGFYQNSTYIILLINLNGKYKIVIIGMLFEFLLGQSLKVIDSIMVSIIIACVIQVVFLSLYVINFDVFNDTKDEYVN